MNLAALFDLFFHNLNKAFFGSSSKISLLYLVGASLVAAFYYRARIEGGAREFFRQAFGRQIWLNKSAAVDTVFFLFMIAGIWNGSAFGYDWQTRIEDFLVIDLGIKHTGLWSKGAWLLEVQILWTLLAVIVRDFGSYGAHALLHRSRVLWRFHAVHHSARQMNFFTLWRMHPLEMALFTACEAAALMVFGWIAVLLFGVAWIPRVAGLYVGFRAALAFFAQFRHSMVWLPYPNSVSHVLISPAMHQIHHSRKPEHQDKNLGVSFALWDWLFGTLYVPKAEDRVALDMGVSDDEGLQHDSFSSLLFHPFINGFHTLTQASSPAEVTEPISAVSPLAASSKARANSGNVDSNEVPRTRSS